MFERLLAALIILALLVLVMFIALPAGDLGKFTTTTKPEPTAPEVAAKPEVNKPEAAKPEVVPAQNPQPKPVPDETIVAANETPIPPLPEKSPLRTAPVPSPTGNAAETAKGTPTPKAPQDRAVASSDGPPRQKFVKYFLDRLPLSPAAEPPPRSSTTGLYDQLPPPPPPPSRPKLNSAKSDKLYIERRHRNLAQRPAPRFAARETRERSDDIGNYIRRTDDAPNAWYRARYYDCPDGQCDCDCPHPYWASSAGCWD
jgi:hypothetical protein